MCGTLVAGWADAGNGAVRAANATIAANARAAVFIFPPFVEAMHRHFTPTASSRKARRSNPVANIIPDRMTAEVDAEFVVFLIGMRVNRWWKIHKWLPVATAMTRMLRELQADPESGLLGFRAWFGNPSNCVQYWRSFEHLERFAKDATRAHRPAWAAFNR